MTADIGSPTGRPLRGNYVSEWFGHRVFPDVATAPNSIADQRLRRCPFLSEALGQTRVCIKPAASQGICTISTTSTAGTQDWLVCPYRALDPALITDAARRLFRVSHDRRIIVVPAPTLADESNQAALAARIRQGEVAVLFFQDKLGGEISVVATDRSPELAFDITMAEVVMADGVPGLGKYGILEVQTMDFHGSYRAVVNNLQDALRLHGTAFHDALGRNRQWLSERIEGPNIANVFKRTFYQIMLKFQIGADESCAGCILALPTSVWDSWQRHLGKPTLEETPDGEFALWSPDRQGVNEPSSAWIYLFDIAAAGLSSPSPISVSKVIATDADSMSYYALKVAPAAAVSGAGASDRVLSSIRRRASVWWPALSRGPVQALPKEP